jgi:hypothetical protein
LRAPTPQPTATLTHHMRCARATQQRSAWSLLGYYYDHAESDLDVLKSELSAGLASLSGTWAFVLQDRKRHRVVAAASADGGAPLQWGCVRSACLRAAALR